MTTRPSGYGVGKTGTPAFAVRGIVEGFYGRPWTHAQRLDIVHFIADRGMNTFVYTPKDDPLMRREWRSEYSGEELDRLAELVRVCASRGVDFVYCVSPGLSIRYSDAADVAALVTKFRSVAPLGVTSFGLLLDDIPGTLQYDEDLAGWPDLASAHADLSAAVRTGLPAGSTLMVCPTQYFGRGTEQYITRLGSALDPTVELFWTGRLICSPSLDTDDAVLFTASTGRPPLYWDNYPVNDVAMTHELHLGPYRGRDADLDAHARGVIANGMEYAESSKIAFATIADYLWSPADYDPEASWLVALRDVVGSDRDLPAFAMFADTVRSSCLSLDDAPELVAALERFALLVHLGRDADAAATLHDYADRALDAADHLLGGAVVNRALIAEAEPWIRSFRVGAVALQRIAALAADGRLDDAASTDLADLREQLIAARRRVFGDALDMTLTDLVAPPVPRTTAHHVPSHKEAAP